MTFSIGGPDGTTRAEHATSCNQMLIVLQGKVRLDLDNGSALHSVTGTPLDAAFLVVAGVWRSVVALEPESLVMVLADASYEDTRYFLIPIRHLIETNARTL